MIDSQVKKRLIWRETNDIVNWRGRNIDEITNILGINYWDRALL